MENLRGLHFSAARMGPQGHRPSSQHSGEPLMPSTPFHLWLEAQKVPNLWIPASGTPGVARKHSPCPVAGVWGCQEMQQT